MASASFEFHTYAGSSVVGWGNFFFKLLGGKANAVCLRQGQAVIFHIIAYGALYFFDVVHTACHGAYHVHPENVLHAGAGDVQLFSFAIFIQAVGDGLQPLSTNRWPLHRW